MLFTVNAMGQEVSVSKPSETNSSQVEAKQDVVSVVDGSPKRITSLSATSPTANSALPSNPQAGDETWQLEIRPYLWGAGMFGRLRVRNTTVETGKSATAILGMLDFAAATQLEAKKNRWAIMFDENYVNLGTTATGPLGATSVDVEPTMNLFEFGASYEFARGAKFSAEALGGGRYIHFALSLKPQNTAAVEGGKNLIGVFVGNRFKVRPHRAVTLTGKYTVGTSGIGSQFAWSADALVDLHVKKNFSIGGGYRWLGLNADDVNDVAGFDGTMRGVIFTATIFH